MYKLAVCYTDKLCTWGDDLYQCFRRWQWYSASKLRRTDSGVKLWLRCWPQVDKQITQDFIELFTRFFDRPEGKTLRQIKLFVKSEKIFKVSPWIFDSSELNEIDLSPLFRSRKIAQALIERLRPYISFKRIPNFVQFGVVRQLQRNHRQRKQDQAKIRASIIAWSMRLDLWQGQTAVGRIHMALQHLDFAEQTVVLDPALAENYHVVAANLLDFSSNLREFTRDFTKIVQSDGRVLYDTSPNCYVWANLWFFYRDLRTNVVKFALAPVVDRQYKVFTYPDGYQHAEAVLFRYLCDLEHLAYILRAVFGAQGVISAQDAPHIVFEAVMLHLHTTYAMCGGCEKKAYTFMSDRSEGAFLAQLELLLQAKFGCRVPQFRHFNQFLVPDVVSLRCLIRSSFDQGYLRQAPSQDQVAYPVSQRSTKTGLAVDQCCNATLIEMPVNPTKSVQSNPQGEGEGAPVSQACRLGNPEGKEQDILGSQPNIPGPLQDQGEGSLVAQAGRLGNPQGEGKGMPRPLVVSKGVTIADTVMIDRHENVKLSSSSLESNWQGTTVKSELLLLPITAETVHSEAPQHSSRVFDQVVHGAEAARVPPHKKLRLKESPGVATVFVMQPNRARISKQRGPFIDKRVHAEM